jgi:tetrahydromethanopterin S-methyltransferase subunit C
VEDGIDAEAGEAGGEEFGLLLAVPCGSVGFVAGLDLLLGVVREVGGEMRWRWLTGSFWQLSMRES